MKNIDLKAELENMKKELDRLRKTVSSEDIKTSSVNLLERLLDKINESIKK